MSRKKTLQDVSDDLERRWEEFQRVAAHRPAKGRRSEDGAAWLDRLDGSESRRAGQTYSEER